jgi:hypothetical protein
MNIFILDKDPVMSAQLQCDKHVVKMILELSQMLSTAHHLWDSSYKDLVYRKTHVNHPCSIWVRETSTNYDWAYNHFIALCDEYTYRYNKTHLTDTKLRVILSNNPVQLGILTPFVLAMPDEYKCSCSIQSYRNYYIGDKRHLFSWTKRDTPQWVS